MDGEKISRLVADIETDRVERKESIGNGDRVCEAICAFADDLPGDRPAGVVAIGVDDDGRPTGLAIHEDLLLRLAAFRDNGKIYPFPSMTVDRLVMKGLRLPLSWSNHPTRLPFSSGAEP